MISENKGKDGEYPLTSMIPENWRLLRAMIMPGGRSLRSREEESKGE